jgi:uncharacterized protein YcbK (DUF882 family)
MEEQGQRPDYDRMAPPAGAPPAGGASARVPTPAEPHDVPIWESIEHVVEHAIDEILTLPDAPHSRWSRAGLSARGERIFERISAFVLLLFAIGWTWTLADAAARGADESGEGAGPTVGSRIASALTTPGTPALAYLTDATMQALVPLRGESGRLRATFQSPRDTLALDSLPAGAEVALARGADTITLADSSGGNAAGTSPGLWGLVVRAGNVIKPITDLTVITLVPSSARRNGRIGLYYIGSWPTERGRGKGARPNYAPPSGFIEVTRENQDTYVSDHFRLRDFLTHDQQNVWPKYLVVESRLLDKLELVLADLEARGIRTSGARVMSGFRTPQYNAGGGNTAGRAELSRHMYGDASDIFIDSDGNGVMDDLNKDGRVNIADARVILAAVDRVEREHPALLGGAGVYTAGPGHGPFIHIDTRGYRARWVGSGD